ncbi:polysaccharide deacetylase family protein [Dictyobacter arantiisoli]|uniref:NodB homology domain-containing protein n=1 Tax=Dictyobacter arantiisoli TaxID=2014874 RepID=A0A5A5T885_9CHLR|nr:polysaccharide deacetylase family protein [Dictyobacter arantiisoli]GCF07618.1 hypothetical protein KDI_11820 [Dictyobacter arantiisoli]
MLLLSMMSCADQPSGHLLTTNAIPYAPDALKATPTPRPTPTPAPVPTMVPAIPSALTYSLFYHGNEQRKEIALSFDDGPSITYTPQILRILRQFHLHATFFNIGQNVLQYPQITKEVYAEGNVIGNHSWNHPDLTTLSPVQVLWQMTYTNQIIQQTIGTKPLLMRPPYGAINRPAHIQIENAGLLPILWNVDTEDWKRAGVASIVANVMNETKNGSIILMHDGGGDRTQTIAALPIIITNLEQQGYQIVPMQELLNHAEDVSTPTIQSVKE